MMNRGHSADTLLTSAAHFSCKILSVAPLFCEVQVEILLFWGALLKPLMSYLEAILKLQWKNLIKK
jgi:hypothetical protein